MLNHEIDPSKIKEGFKRYLNKMPLAESTKGSLLLDAFSLVSDKTFTFKKYLEYMASDAGIALIESAIAAKPATKGIIKSIAYLREYLDKDWPELLAGHPNQELPDLPDISWEKTLKEKEEIIAQLSKKFKEKQSLLRNLIEQRFPPPQLTYDRFSGEIGQWEVAFTNQTDLVLSIVKLTPRRTNAVEQELDRRTQAAQSIMDLLNDFIIEMTISIGRDRENIGGGDIEELINEMKTLLASVRDYDENGYDCKGFDKNGFDHSGRDREGYDRNGYNEGGYDRYGYDRNGFNREGYNRSGYDRNGFNRSGRNREGYDRNGYNRLGLRKDGSKFDTHGFDKDGYNEGGYDRSGYDRKGFNRQGTMKDGSKFDTHGFDCMGFDKKGFDHSGRDREGYDRNGYNEEGYDRSGYDRKGFNRLGLTKDGSKFDTHGFDKDGYNEEGYDRNGFNRQGLTKDGSKFDIHGFDKKGFDHSGRDREGYDRNGYDEEGFDRHGFDKRNELPTKFRWV